MSLRDWQKNGWLIEHRTSPEEIKDLLGLIERDLADCRTPGLSTDWRFSIAYNAALQTATVALAASGYRAAREAHHYRIIQSLAHTITADKDVINQLNRFRKKRNIGGYERVGTISDMEADEVFTLAKNLLNDVDQWLRKNHPVLFKKNE